ncbi:MAG: winged helix-turn-helix transcriptional regulator [Planctomycetes bacterium]|nr:winged helix-turn-helix transcriptional regulator [Planctomycetota bacterium]
MVAGRFKVLAEPARLHLLNVLMAGERTVGDLVETTGLNQANVSKHLALLAEAGFVSRRKEGLHAWYVIADSSVFKLCDLMCSAIARKLGKDLQAVK